MSEKFHQNPHGTNELLNGNGFYISYNLNPCHDWGRFFGPDTPSGETALMIENGRPDGDAAWLILNGDYRAEYEEAFPRGLAACVAVYEARRAEHRSSWSVDGERTLEDVLAFLAARVATPTERREPSV